jgi:superfamily II DNA/RNA helicase
MGSLRKMIGGGGAFVVVGRLESACTYCSRHDYNQYKRRITNDKKCLIFHVSSRNNGFIGTQSFREGLECFPVKTSEPQFSRGWNCSRLGKHVIGSQSRSELSRGEDEQFVATTTEAMLEGHVPSTTVVSKENLEEKPSTVSRRSTSRSQTDLNRASSSFSRVPSSGTRSSKKHTTLDVIEADDKQVAFTNFQLSGKILDVLEERGFHNSTPIQSATYELIHSGRDIIGRSRTGTGKTLAFVLPIMQRLVEDFEARGNERSTHIQCLVLAPTRELAKQVEQEFLAFAKPFHFRTSCFFGGSSYEVQHRAINRGIDILVATPGRLIDHLERGNIDLSKVKFFILDEADEMLSMGFAEDIEKILTYVPSTQERQTLLFSATIPPWIQDLARKNQNNPIVVDAIGKKDTKTSTTVEHIAIRVPSTELARRLVLESVLSVYSAELTNFRCIVFARTKAEVDSLVSSSRIQNGAAQALHGDITQKQREITLSKFREGLFQVLIATDVAARGLDISGVDLVIQYRIPEDIDMYIHRAGRTGRAGRQGTCVVLYTDEERSKLNLMQNVCKIRFRLESPPSVQHVIETKAKSLLRSIQGK